MNQNYKPLRSLTPADARGNVIGEAITDLPQPNIYKWGKADFSAPDAGRLESGRALKKRRGKVVKLDLEWTMPSLATAALVLQAFDYEYCLVEYLDTKAGTWQTRHFYTGDMGSQLYTLVQDGCWESIHFSIFQATPDK